MTLPEALQALNGRITDKIYLFGLRFLLARSSLVMTGRENAPKSVESDFRRAAKEPEHVDPNPAFSFSFRRPGYAPVP
ncbi:hypothetical protein PSEUDO8O_30970 [Pseudomonas sp. 8O]|nr:hypothetical protein PSEUDO8O_30970 [Pseudomonas sp. 8O]